MEMQEGKYLLKLAKTPEEKQAGYLLRYRVYSNEFHFAGEASKGEEENIKDCDLFDEFCDHLLIIDETNNRCAGTFRFLPGSRLPKDGGFYSEQWFHIGHLSEQRGEILELGRACIDPEYRNTSVFKLLFSGLGAYLKMYPHKYLIGLTTLPSNAKNDIGSISQYLVKNNAVNFGFGVQPRKHLVLTDSDYQESEVIEINPKTINKMSTLMFAYYKYGAKFVSEPSMDVDFNPPVFDYFTIFETQKFPGWVQA